MISTSKLTVVAAFVLSLVPSAAMTSDAPSLKEIMQGLRDDTVRISDGLLTDDFELVAQAADAIANHPKIPAEDAQRVAAELGDEMASFKALDTLVHDLAIEVAAAARVEDRGTAAAGFQQMFDGCLACHDAYKDRVASALEQ